MERSSSDVRSEDELDDLMSLGYLNFSTERADKSKSGVMLYDADKASPGYTLFTIRNSCRAVLVDMRGEVVNHWRGHPCRFWDHAELLADGRLAAPNTRSTLQVFSWEGKLVSEHLSRVHHDVEEQGDGSLRVLTSRDLVDKRNEEFSKGTPTRVVADNVIVELSASGETLDEVSIFAVLDSNPSVHTLTPIKPKEDGERRFLDLLHTNAIHRMRPIAGRDHRIYSTDNVLFTSRHQHVVAIFDWQSRELLWAWGPGEIEGPHDPTLLDNGNILLFDNGLRRRWSRIIEVDPETKEIVWQYDGRPDHGFFTAGRGSAQRLPNGNTLFASSDQGHAAEVTPDGTIVWEFWLPVFNDEGRRATIGRATRYPGAMIDAFRNGEGQVP